MQNTMVRGLRAAFAKAVRLGRDPVRRGPLRLLIDPTYACNLACIGCHSTKVARFFKGETKLSRDEYARVVREFASLGGQSVSIYGGEPLLVPETFDIIAAATQAKLVVRLCTNALLLDAAKAARLIDLRLSELTISIDGVGDVYESIRGRGNFRKFVAGVTAFERANADAGARRIPLVFHATVERNNVGTLVEILRFGRDHGANVVSFAHAARVAEDVDRATELALDASFNRDWNHWLLPNDIMVTDEQVPELRAEAQALGAEAQRLGITVWLDPALSDEAPGTSLPEGRYELRKPCPIADETAMLGPGGHLALCPMLTHHPVASVRDVSLRDYWASNAQLLKLRRLLGKGEYLPVCRHCTNHSNFM